MGKVKNDWQDRDYVLKWLGGGLIKSYGGGSAAKALKSGSRRRKITIVRSQLRAYRDGDNSVLIPGKIGFCFLNTNDFEDLPHLR